MAVQGIDRFHLMADVFDGSKLDSRAAYESRRFGKLIDADPVHQRLTETTAPKFADWRWANG